MFKGLLKAYAKEPKKSLVALVEIFSGLPVALG